MIKEGIGPEVYHYLDRNAYDLTTYTTSVPSPYALRNERKIAVKTITAQNYSDDVHELICDHLSHLLLKDVVVTDTRSLVDINHADQKDCKAIVNLEVVNNYKRINKFFETVNDKLPEGGLFINAIETYTSRKKKLLKKFPKPLNYIYYCGDFIWNRICPKLSFTKKLYFKITKGYGRVLTKAETLGRLYSCGFDVVAEHVIDDKLYFVAKKSKAPTYDMDPSYGPLIRLKRVGKNGKPIHVLKFRTMYPYSEYLQQYVFDRNSLKDGGKIKNDFRISNEGRMMRKYWIDELPMFINFFKGDMKLIGGRPLSSHYFSLYSKELQEKRTRFKPGLIPPYYADMPTTLDEIMESEMRYLKAYEQNPIGTDITYGIKIIKNIVFKGKRSA